MTWLCGFAFALVLIAAVGHAIWLIGAAVLNGALGTSATAAGRPARPFRYCPGCGHDTDERDQECSRCDLRLDGQRARKLHRIRVAQHEIDTLIDAAHVDRASAEPILQQLETRARTMQGLPAAKRPVANPPARQPRPEPEPLAPAEAVELISTGASAPLAELLAPPSEAGTAAADESTGATLPVVHPNATARAEAPEPVPEAELGEPNSPAPPPPPKRRLSHFLEEHNILWGELVGGLLIVGCSVALVVTLRQTLEALPYFQFLLSAAVTLGLFGAGQYTLHRWKLAGTSRGLLVIAMLLTPLTMLLLSEPFTRGAAGALDVGVKLAAVAAFVLVVRTGGRDLIGTDHLPGPVDRRWLLALAVVGATGTQLLPTVSVWPPLLCFGAACFATLGGLSWYHPGRRSEPVSDKTGTALLMFTGLSGAALLAAWGLFVIRSGATGAGPGVLALPLALAGMPVVEAGVLVLRRTTAVGLRTVGTAVALVGFVTMTLGLALAWPDPLTVLFGAAATGAFLTRVAFRERLPWIQAGALPLLTLAVVVAYHWLTGNGNVPSEVGADEWLGTRLRSAEGVVPLVCFALVLGLIAELLARRSSRQTHAYAFGALGVGSVGLLLANWYGVERPALAAAAHAALAAGLLVSNARWKLGALARAGLWLVLAATLWALWWQHPRQPALWGFVLAVEALVLAVGAVALRGTRARRSATALLRRAGRDVSFVACVLSVVLAASSAEWGSPWHARMLFTLTLALVALARLTGSALFTSSASVTLLLGLVQFNAFALDTGSIALGVELAVLLHATLATGAAIVCRRQGRVFGDPFRWAAHASSLLAVPLLFVPPAGLAFVYAPLAVWLGGVWLAFALRWRTGGAFSAAQAAVTLSALLLAFGWIERQPWWASTPFHLLDPRALHAFGIALGALALVWVIGRRVLRPLSRARELWHDDPVSLDRIVLGAAVVGFLLLGVVAIGPAVEAELTPINARVVVFPPELLHAFDPTAWAVLALLAGAVLLSWRLSGLERDANPHAIGLALLALSVPVVWAGAFAVDVAAASALRWGLAGAFVLGSAAVALRVPLGRATRAAGFPVRTQPWLGPVLLGLFAGAAAVVIGLSVQVAALGLNHLQAGGPNPRSVFALMGAMASNLIPLALVVFGLAVTAARERSSGYALSGGLVFVATLTAGYALAVVTAGHPLDAAEQTRLCLVAAASAAVWALLWLGTEWRVPGGIPLGVQTCLGFAALGPIALVAAIGLIARPDEPLSAAFEPLGRFGWLTLTAVCAAGFWHLRRQRPEAVPLVFGFAGLCSGVLATASVLATDVPGWWLSFHVLALVWAAAGFALFAAYPRSPWGHGVVIALATALLVCALRGGWSDPWRPWLPAGLALSAALRFGGVGLVTRSTPLVGASGLAVNLAATFVWLAWGADTVSGFLLANVIGLTANVAFWTLVLVRMPPAPNENDQWLRWFSPMLGVALVLLVVGLAPALGAVPNVPRALNWSACAAVALAAAVGLWDRFARYARPVLYSLGALTAVLAVVELDTVAVWESALSPLALASFVLGVAALAVGVMRRSEPLLGMPTNDAWRFWLPGTQTVVAVAAVVLGVRIGFVAPSIWERLASPLAVLMLAPAFALLARVAPRLTRTEMRTLAVVLVALAPAALALAVPGPFDTFAALHRTGWLFVALALTAAAGSRTAPLLGAHWLGVVRTVAGWTAALAVGVLCLNLLQQVPVYDPVRRLTPLARGESLAMLGALTVLFALALSFAPNPDRDPFRLRPNQRTAYVYLAEVFIVLFFAQVKFNVPELFLGELAKLWTFAVMVLAYVGIGLAELFERKKVEVLALPLRRTGVLLPLVPLIAFWAKPPAFVTDFARDTAPGLGPFLTYLEKLPQNFETYAWLWFLAGGVYGLVALSRNSFGWALLGALATNAALWALFTHHQVPFVVHPQAWVIPLALIVLVSEHLNRTRLSRGASDAMRYAGISMIYIASAADMFIAGVGNSMWLPVILAVLCVAGVFGGILLRVRAFVYLGVGFLLLDLFSMIWHAAVDLQQTWVWYASGIVLGVVVLALFAYLEKRRTHEKEAVESE